MGGISGIIGIIGFACGIYCIYAYIMMKKTGEINKTVLLAKDADPKKCKDKEAYLKYLMPKVLALGIGTTVYGAVDICETYVMRTGYLYPIMLLLFFIVLVWFIVSMSKANKKYF